MAEQEQPLRLPESATYECVAATKTTCNTHTHGAHTHFICQSGYSHIRPIVQHQLQQQAAGHLLPEKTKRSSSRGRGITWLQLAAPRCSLHAVTPVTMLPKNILSLPSCACSFLTFEHTMETPFFLLLPPIASCMHYCYLFPSLSRSPRKTNLGKLKNVKSSTRAFKLALAIVTNCIYAAEGLQSTRGGEGEKFTIKFWGNPYIVIPCYMACDLWFLADCAFPLIILVHFDIDSLRS